MVKRDKMAAVGWLGRWWRMRRARIWGKKGELVEKVLGYLTRGW